MSLGCSHGASMAALSGIRELASVVFFMLKSALRVSISQCPK